MSYIWTFTDAAHLRPDTSRHYMNAECAEAGGGAGAGGAAAEGEGGHPGRQCRHPRQDH